MKVAIYIEQGVTQLVLTPDSEWEKKVLAQYAEGHSKVRIMRGGFYECQGGWVRHGTYQTENSLILRVDQETSPPETWESE